MDMTMDTLNIQLASTPLLEWTVPQLERYICCHGLRTFRRSVLRDLLHNRVHPVYPSIWRILVFIAQTLYRHGPDTCGLWYRFSSLRVSSLFLLSSPIGPSSRCLGLVAGWLLRSGSSVAGLPISSCRWISGMTQCWYPVKYVFVRLILSGASYLCCTD